MLYFAMVMWLCGAPAPVMLIAFVLVEILR
jgi:hypothetical protein